MRTPKHEGRDHFLLVWGASAAELRELLRSCTDVADFPRQFFRQKVVAPIALRSPKPRENQFHWTRRDTKTASPSRAVLLLWYVRS